RLLSSRQEERRDAAAGRGGEALGEVTGTPLTIATMLRARLFAVLALVVALAVQAGAAPLADREVLGNGVRLLVASRPAGPIAGLGVYLGAGSAFDPPDAPGLANLTAELLPRGTAKRTGPELDRAIEFVGGSLEADAGRDGATVSLAVLKKDLDLG